MMPRQVVCFAVTFLLGVFQNLEAGRRIPNFAGPFRVIVRRVSNESHEAHKSRGLAWSEIHVTYPRPGQLQYRWGYTYSDPSVAGTEAFKLDVRMARWANNQWKENDFVMIFNHACSAFIKYGPSIVSFFLGKVPQKCPFASGLRELKNETFDLSFPLVPIFPYGRYRFSLEIHNETVVAYFYSVVVDIVPRV